MNTEIETTQLPGILQKPVVHVIEGVQVMALPPGWTERAYEDLLQAPRRISARITANDVRGFIDYTKRHAIVDVTTIYADSAKSPRLVARIDDNANIDAEALPSHVSHTCTFPCPLTHEWQQWIGNNNKYQGQVEFAEFIENNLLDVIEPNSAELLTACLNFQDTGKAEFKSGVRLQDGRVDFHLVEKDTTGAVKFPGQLTVALPVFEGMDTRFSLKAKLRYRIDKDAGLRLMYVLDRPDLALKAAYERLIEQVGTGTGLPVIRAI